jgi:trehalose 6-phosphate phosphatase
LNSDAKPQVESLIQAVSRAPQSLLMLDYDGTIAPFRQDPEQAFPYPGVSRLLQQIVRTGKTRLVIISGRDASEVVPLLNIDPHPEVWGLHGLQRLKPDGSVELSPLDESTLAALGAAEDWLLYQHLQHAAELKTGSIAVHWRGLSECETEAIRGRVLLGWTVIAKDTGLDLLEFNGGVEIRAPEADKGDAVRTILSEMNSDTPAAYLGDDTTDEHAFQAVNGRGLSILVRPRWRRTAAQWWLTPPDEVLDFLNLWFLACQERDSLSDDASLEVNV